MSNFNIKAGCFSLLVLLFSVFPVFAFAANSTSELGVSPAFQELQLQEGHKEVDGSILITNNTSQSTILKVSVIDLSTLQASAGQPFLGDAELSNDMYGLSKWVHLKKQDITVLAKSSQLVTFNIQDDPSLLAGGHYGAILLKSPITGSSATGAAIQPIVSSLILLEKSGLGEQRTVALTHFSYVGHWFNLPTRILASFKNTGNVHLAPHGLITLCDPLDHEVSKGLVNADSSVILPGSSREYQTLLTSHNPVLLPGIYTLALQYRINGNDQPVRSAIRFLYIPPLAMAVGVIFLVIFIIFFIKRLIRKK